MGSTGGFLPNPGAATGITHLPAAICATRNTHQRLSALSVVPTGSYLSHQCSSRPGTGSSNVDIPRRILQSSIGTNPHSEDALCEVLQIDEIPVLRTTDPPRLHQPKRHLDSIDQRVDSFRISMPTLVSISQRKAEISEIFKKSLKNSDGNANPRFIEILWASPHE